MARQIVPADASELVQGLLSPAPSEAFSIFRPQPDGTTKEFPIRVRLLRAEENIAALAESQAYARKMGEISKDYGEIYRESQAYEVAARCACHPDEKERPDGTKYYRQLFVDAKQVRESLTENEVAAILNCYEVVKARYRCLEDFDAEGIDTWAARLSDDLLGQFFLSQLDSGAWPALLLSLAREVRLLREATGHPLPSSLGISESDPESSESGTSGSISSVTAQLSDGEKVPSGEPLITREQATEIAKKRRK